MVITGFRAEKVFGFLEFDIQFNRDVNFLVGGNGTGKTTALRLINAMVTPNFKELLKIQFDQAWLMLEDNKETHFISVMTEGGTKTLHISGIPDKLVLPAYSHFEVDYINRNGDKFDDMIDEINRKFADHEVMKKLAHIQSPIFLGLDRHSESFSESRNDYMLEREMRTRATSNRDFVTKRLARGNLAIGLTETEVLVQSAYRRLRELEERQSTRLRDSVLLSSFKFSRFSLKNAPMLLPEKERSRLLNKKIEIKEALSKIGVRNSRLGSELDEFFEQLGTLFEDISGPQNGNSGIEWLLNKNQIDRMAEIVEIIDEHKSKVDEIFKPISFFLSTINSFLCDSNKYVEIDAVGKLTVKRPDGTKSSIEGLSSGERQLLVIFAHACLNQRPSRPKVFIIDEPELSLHLSWQEKFSETIFRVSPQAQFIMATHSPEIIGVNKLKAVQCRQV